MQDLAEQHAQGVSLEKAFASARPPIWDKRKPLYSKALQRSPGNYWRPLLSLAQQIDAQAKGQAPGDAWQSLASLCLQMAGQKLRL